MKMLQRMTSHLQFFLVVRRGYDNVTCYRTQQAPLSMTASLILHMNSLCTCGSSWHDQSPMHLCRSAMFTTVPVEFLDLSSLKKSVASITENRCSCSPHSKLVSTFLFLTVLCERLQLLIFFLKAETFQVY